MSGCLHYYKRPLEKQYAAKAASEIIVLIITQSRAIGSQQVSKSDRATGGRCLYHDSRVETKPTKEHKAADLTNVMHVYRFKF